MTNQEIWVELHMLLVSLCVENKITESQHSAWELAIEQGPS